jgi:hypothetical protein
MLTTQEVNTLGQILDTTWGKSSTTASPTMSVKGKLADDKLTIIYTTYATFSSNVAMSQQMPRLMNEGQKACDQYLKYVKDEFSDAQGKALKAKLVDTEHSVEVISLQPHVSPKRTVLFRFISAHEVS